MNIARAYSEGLLGPASSPRMSLSDLGYVSPMEESPKGPPKPTKARFALAANVKDLMARYNKGFGLGIEAVELAQGSGLSAKTIRRILDPYNDKSPNLETIDALADFFRLESWELLKPREKALAISGAERRTPAKPAYSPASSEKERTRSKKA